MVNFFNFLEMGNLYTFCLSSRLYWISINIYSSMNFGAGSSTAVSYFVWKPPFLH